MTEEVFIEQLNNINIFPTSKQLDQLEKYYNLLIEWNNKINLTTITEKKDVYLKHFFDSLTITKVIDLNNENTLLDFGTGAGFPGLVLKIFYPHLKVTLVDSLQKRIKFLNIVIETLNLTDISTLHERVENLQYHHYDIITTRAVANLSKLLIYTHNIIDNTSKFIPLKANVDMEIKAATTLLKKYKLSITTQKTFYLPIENSLRNILVITKK